MKIRLGHISNSSSSSFIIWAKRLPTDKEEIKNLFYPDQEFVIHHYSSDLIPVDSVVDHISDEFKHARTDMKSLEEEIIRDQWNDYNDYPNQDVDDWHDLQRRRRDYSLLEIMKLIESKELGVKHFIVEFSDDSIIGSHVENSDDIFKVFPMARKISNH